MCVVLNIRLKRSVLNSVIKKTTEKKVQIRSFMGFNDQFWLFIPSIATTNKLRTFVTNLWNLFNDFKNKNTKRTHTHTRAHALHNNKKSRNRMVTLNGSDCEQ